MAKRKERNSAPVKGRSTLPQCLFRHTIVMVMAAWLFVYVSALQPSNGPRHQHRQNVLQWADAQKSRKLSLFLSTTKDAYIVEQNMEYLRESLGFTDDRLQDMSETTNILTLDNGVLMKRANWLKKRLKLKQGEIKKIIQSQPHILGRLSITNLAPKLDYLQTKLLLDDNALRKLILSAPHILPCSIEDNIEPTLDWLQQRLGLNDASLSKMISRQPYTLGCSISENLEPTLDWLQRRLDLDNAAYGKMIQTYPQIMHLSIESNIEPKLEWLKQRLNLDDDAAVGKMIQRSPSILGLSIDSNLQPKLEWIQDSLSLTDDGLSKFVQKFPSIFSCNVDRNLEPTLMFYISALGDEVEALTLVTQNPSLFAYSLEKRLKPRLKESQDAGIVIDAACLRRIGQCTDNQWHTWKQELQNNQGREAGDSRLEQPRNVTSMYHDGRWHVEKNWECL